MTVINGDYGIFPDIHLRCRLPRVGTWNERIEVDQNRHRRAWRTELGSLSFRKSDQRGVPRLRCLVVARRRARGPRSGVAGAGG